ncbi:ThuA domain-containing protein [Flagellimonas onchidii]|uniref:ThuA domain-containing protein n=1 Tax=Flagellimonas onchidii TaxID=2562684 RepID=UPI0010A5AA11|nr:ThuA domain-containing protein [Allomuricauda onchidii]
MRSIKFSLILFCFAFFANAQEAIKVAPNAKMPDLVLVFTKTEGYRHKAIEKGARALRQLGRTNDFIALQSETAEDFNIQNLRNFKLVIFLNTTMDILNTQQQRVMELYIKRGGSFMGIHAAADTEYEWPWYGKLVGAYFESHPEQQQAKIDVVDGSHPSTAHLKNEWLHFDEWYNFKNLNPNAHVLMRLDETSYKGGTNGNNHPIAWYHEFDGGRAFYTGLGHTEASYDDDDFKQHLLGAIEWCLRRK